MTHLVPLGDTGWSVWRDVLLRTAGFPVDGLARFTAADCAQVADRHLAGEVTDEVFRKAYGQATDATAEQVCDIAADPLFREAVAWQNPEVLVALDGLVAAGPRGPRNVRRRGRENTVAGYWQRYAAKTETVGFFGPVCWGVVEPGSSGVTVRPGPELVRERRLYLEYWALAECAARLAADPQVRQWLAPVLPPHLSLAGRLVQRPAQSPAPVTEAEAAALGLCDGTRPAVAVVEALLSADHTGVRRPVDGYLLLTNLVDRGLLRWDADLPPGFDAEEVLRQRLAAVGDPAARDRAMAALDRLTAARKRVAAAAGDPARLTTELSTLDVEFTALTAGPPRRRAGQSYAGRSLCHEETVRDLEFAVGGGLLDLLAPALGLALQAARWLTCALAEAYRAALRELYIELVAEDRPVRLADLWFLVQGSLFGTGPRPADTVARDFAGRWARVFGLADVPDGTRRLDFTTDAIAARVAAEFPAARAGWSAGRIHSPDLMVGARSADALARGKFFAVLGELHAAWPTFDAALFTDAHPDVAALRRALAADLGPHRLRPLYPVDYPRTGGRLVHSLTGPTDRQLAFADAPGADRARLLPASAAIVSEVDGELVVTGPDGHRWPLLEAFSALVAMPAAEAFKVMTDRPHTPRVTVDRLVLARETFRTTAAQTGLVDGTDPAGRYLAVRRWRAALGLPERVFVRPATELKPSYVDLTSPLYTSRLCLMMRAAARAGGGGVPVVVTEQLPTAEQAWVPDARGRRYVSELRLQVRDPAEPEGGPG